MGDTLGVIAERRKRSQQEENQGTFATARDGAKALTRSSDVVGWRKRHLCTIRLLETLVARFLVYLDGFDRHQVSLLVLCRRRWHMLRRVLVFDIECEDFVAKESLVGSGSSHLQCKKKIK